MRRISVILIVVALALASAWLIVLKREGDLRREFESAERNGNWMLLGGGVDVPIARWAVSMPGPVPVSGLRGGGSQMGGLQFGVSSDGARVALQIDAGPMQVVERGQAKVVAAFPRPPYPPGVTDACPSFDIDGALQFVRTEFGQSRYNLGYLVSIDASVPGAPPVEVRGVTNVCTVMCPCPEATRDGMYMAWVAFQDTSLKTEIVHLARREASGAKRGWRVFRSWADSREFALDPTGRFIAIKDARGIHREAISNSSDRFDFGGSLRASPIAVSPDGKWLMTAYRGLSMFDERPLVIYRASDGRSFSTSLPEPYFDGGGTGPEGWIWTDAIH